MALPILARLSVPLRFCDIITLYGRKPRTKTAAQMIAELEADSERRVPRAG